MALLDLFRSQWNHSDPERRAHAIRHMEDDRRDIFLSAAVGDPDAGIRLIAAKRLTAERDLRKVLIESSDKPVQDAVRKALAALVSQQALGAGPSASEGEIRGWIDELRGAPGGDKLLEDLAVKAKAPAVRRATLGALTHAASYLAVALGEEQEDIALAAFGKLSRENHLQAAAKNARSRAVRDAAREKLRAVESAKKPDAGALNRAKLGILLTSVERAAASAAEPGRDFAWDAAAEQVDEAEQALGDLEENGLRIDAAALGRFREQAAFFRNRYAQHRAVEAERAERDRAERGNKEALEQLCARMEALYAESGPADAEEAADLARRCNAVGSSADDQGLRERFRIARERIREKLQKQREQDEAGRRKNASAAAQARLEELVRAAEEPGNRNGKQGDAGHIAGRLEELRSEWDRAQAVAGEFPAKEDLTTRFRTALSALDTVVEGARAGAAAKLEGWITELESLAEATDPKQAEKRLKEIQGRWKSLIALIPENTEGLALRYHAAADHLRETLDWNRWANLRRKQDICTQLEALLEAGDRKAMVGRFKDLIAEWKEAGQVPWESTEALWDRYHQVCDALYEKFQEYFAELDVEREANLKAKEEICAKLEGLLATEEMDWREATESFREAHSNWKAIGAVPREKNEALWDRFRAVSRVFHDRKDGQYKDNLRRKQELAALAERLKDSTEWKSAAASIKEAQEKWKAIGPVPRDKSEALWSRFHGATEAFFQARKAHFDQLDQERPLNLEKKIALCELVEKLDELPGDKERYERILDAQTQWKEIGPVPREQEDALWERFRGPLDAYFQGRRQKMEAERGQREESAKLKEDLCVEAEALRDSTDWKETIERIKTLQARWKESGSAPRSLDQQLWQRFRTACDAFFDRLKENSALRDQERDANLRRKLDLCFTAEILSGRTPDDDDALAARNAWIETQRAQNLPLPAPAEDWRKAADRVKQLQQEWRKIGPAPRELNDVVWNRFQRACDVFFEENRRAQGLPADDPQANLESKLALIADAEDLARDAGPHRDRDVQELFRKWKRVGPVPRAQSDYVWERFNAACDAATGKTGRG